MKYSLLQVVLSAITTAILVAGSVQLASADEYKGGAVVAVQNQMRDLSDHPVHLGGAERVFSVSLVPAENIEDIAAIYERDGGCE